MNQVTTNAIVLRRTNYHEADRILTAVTDAHGKVSLIAKGARRAKSKLAGGIELFAVNQLSFIKGKRDLHTISSARVTRQFANISKDIDKTMRGYEYLKLIDKITDDHSEEVAGHFEALKEALEGLDDAQLPLPMVDVWFYLHVLDQSGQRPDLRRDTDENPLNQHDSYTFSPEDMQFSRREDGPFRVSHIKLLRIAISLGGTKKLSNIQVEPSIADRCAHLCKSMVEHNLL